MHFHAYQIQRYDIRWCDPTCLYPWASDLTIYIISYSVLQTKKNELNCYRILTKYKKKTLHSFSSLKLHFSWVHKVYTLYRCCVVHAMLVECDRRLGRKQFKRFLEGKGLFLPPQGSFLILFSFSSCPVPDFSNFFSKQRPSVCTYLIVSQLSSLGRPRRFYCNLGVYSRQWNRLRWARCIYYSFSDQGCDRLTFLDWLTYPFFVWFNLCYVSVWCTTKCEELNADHRTRDSCNKPILQFIPLSDRLADCCRNVADFHMIKKRETIK